MGPGSEEPRRRGATSRCSHAARDRWRPTPRASRSRARHGRVASRVPCRPPARRQPHPHPPATNSINSQGGPWCRPPSGRGERQHVSGGEVAGLAGARGKPAASDSRRPRPCRPSCGRAEPGGSARPGASGSARCCGMPRLGQQRLLQGSPDLRAGAGGPLPPAQRHGKGSAVVKARAASRGRTITCKIITRGTHLVPEPQPDRICHLCHLCLDRSNNQHSAGVVHAVAVAWHGAARDCSRPAAAAAALAILV